MNEEKFYQSLNADTWCGWDWCRKVYGYQITDPAFLERVFDRLDELNRDKVKFIYGFYLKTQIAHEIAIEREAGELVKKQIDRDYERQVKEYGNSRNKSGVGNWHGFKGFPSIH